MYRHWNSQKASIIDLIGKRQGSICQVCYGTNYSIFFRNVHSDLILKKNIIPVYLDLNNLVQVTEDGVFENLHIAIRRAILEKKLSYKPEFETAVQEEVEAIDAIVEDFSQKGYAFVIFVED